MGRDKGSQGCGGSMQEERKKGYSRPPIRESVVNELLRRYKKEFPKEFPNRRKSLPKGYPANPPGNLPPS